MMTTGGEMTSLKELPVGYRFNPSDEVLVNYHLKRKLSNIEEEYCLIPEFDIYKVPPWDLITKFNDLSDLAYDGRECLFYHRRSDPNSQRNNRRTKDGFWKVTGGDQKPRVTDQTKWLKKILVYCLGKQGSAVKTGWAMHEYQDISNPTIVVCRIHESKRKKVKERVDSGSSKAWSSGSGRATASSKTQTEPPEVSPETPVNTTTESQSLTDTNIPQYCTSFPKQTQVDTERSLSLSEDTYSDCLHLTDLKDPQSPQILMREQPPFSKNEFIDGCDQENGNWSYLPHVTTEEGGNMVVVYETPNNELLNYELPGFVSPPQHPQKMPTEGISPIIPNSELDIHGWGAQLPVVSVTHGAQETYFKEAPQSALNSQITIPPPNFSLVSPKELQVPQELSSIYNIDHSSDSSGGGSPNAFHFGQSYESQQPNSKVTQDFATGSPAAVQLYDINSLLDSFSASPLQSPFNSQTPIPPPNSYLPPHEEIQMLPKSSSICNLHPSPESSAGGCPSAVHFGQIFESHQTNFEVTRDGSYQVDGSHTYPRGVTLEEGGHISVYHQIPTDQSSNNVLPGFQYPPQHPQTVPTEEISPIVCNTSFNNSGSELDIHGRGAQLPFASWKHGAQETNFEEQMLQELSSISGTNPSSDSSGGGIPNLFHFGQSYESQQTNFEVTRDGSYQVGGSNTYPRGVTLEEGGDMSVYHQIPTDQSSNCVLPVSLYPPQHPRTVPTEEISLIVGNTSLNNSGSELDVHGWGAKLPFASWKHGAQETNFKEFPQSTLNSQTSIPPPNSCLLSPEEQMLQELSSDSSGGGIPNLFHFGQSYESQQTNFEVTRDGSYQVGGSNTYPRGVTLEEGGDMSVYHQIPTDQWSNCVLPGFLYPPQHLGTMPMEEISPIVGNTSFNDSGSELDIHGQGAQLPFASQKHGAQETTFEEFPQSTLNSQTTIPPPNSFLFSPKEQMLQELSLISGTNPSSDSSGGGIPNLFHFGQSYESQQTNFEVTRDGSYQVGGSNTYPRGVTLEEGGDMSVYHQILTDQSSNCVLPGFVYPPQHPGTMPTEEISPIVGNTSFNDRGNELDIHGPAAQLPFPSWKHGAQETTFRVTQDFATESSAVIQYLNTGLLFDSLLASPPETEGSSLSSSSIVPGGYGTEYCGLPYASGVALDKSNHRISATY